MDGAPTHETLRRQAAELWEAMQAHRFVQDIGADRLPREVFLRYLSYECGFVETALLILGHALLKAPDLARRRVLVGVMQGLAGEQIPYFQQAFRALGATPIPEAEFPSAVTRFRDGMLAMAEQGTYLDILAAMLGAEWMYATWCGRAGRQPISDPELHRWVALHTEDRFLRGVAWLKSELDAALPGLDRPAADRAAACFRRTLELEIDFHSAAYEVSEGTERPVSRLAE